MTMILDPRDEASTNGSAKDSTLNHDRETLAAGASRLHPSKLATHRDFWSSAAPKKLRREGLDSSAVWKQYWAKRKAAPSVARLLNSNGSPLAWAVDVDGLSEECRAVVEIAQKVAGGAVAGKKAKSKTAKRQNSRVKIAAVRAAISEWLEAACDGDTNVDFGIGCLAAAHVLHALGDQLGPEQGWALIDFLVGTAEEAVPWTADADGPAGAALSQQLVAGELPLTLAYLFPEMKPLAALARAGRKRLAEGINDLLGDKSMLRAGHLEVLRPLVACWTRSRALGKQLKQGAWPRETQRQFESIVRHSIRWTDGAGRLPLGADDAPSWTADFLAAAVRLGAREPDAVAARTLLARTPLAKEVPRAKAKTPKPCMFSENSSLALLRSDWSPRAATIAIDFSTPGMRLAVSADGRSLFEGVWATTSKIDGKQLQPAAAWEEVCWFSDKDVDYIEFRQKLEDGARLERQILLARTDGFLLLADHLQNASSAVLEHAWQLPMGAELEGCGETETRDALVRSGGKDIARLFPLALPEWRVDPRGGELVIGDGAVKLQQRSAARAVACPLFIDLDPRRIAKPCTWRQLTVAEALQIQPPDVAVGYRIQSGRNQWIMYRSQGPRGNRTLLGQNTACEFLVARFLPKTGGVEELVQVQG